MYPVVHADPLPLFHYILQRGCKMSIPWDLVLWLLTGARYESLATIMINLKWLLENDKDLGYKHFYIPSSMLRRRPSIAPHAGGGILNIR